MYFEDFNALSCKTGKRSGKERRNPYRGSKAFDKTCRNHGSCRYCRDNRLYSRRKAEEKSQNNGRLDNW